MSKFFKNQSAAADRMPTSRGQDVPVDTFLYACLEAEQTAASTSSQNIKWPTLTDLSPEDLDSELAALQLKDIFEDLFSWYAANYPDLATNLAWDYGVVSIIVHPLVALANDLDTVHQRKFGEPLAEIDGHLEEQDQVWALIKSLIDRFFASKSSYIQRYIEWSYGKDKSIAPEPGSRPPVGRNSPGFQNRQQRQAGNGNRGGNGNFRGRDGNNSRNRNQNGGRGDRDRHREAQSRGNTKYDRPRRGPRPEANPEMEAMVIQECKEAIAFLENNPHEEKIALKPQNSFYRRIQHQVIVSNGYHSESMGEDQERTVVIWRKS